jgi:histone deacetylase HOS3
MEIHKSIGGKTVVIVHDSCYGHRYSRPRTSKASLSTIVERPERILASVLGVSAAYVRLGGRHQGGRYAPHPGLDPQLLHTPPFQIRKTTRTMTLSSPAVTYVHGNKWMEELKIMCDSAEGKLALNGKELVRPGSGKDENGTKRKLHEGDLYLCSESLNAFEGALGGVCDGIDAVLGPGNARRAFVAIRPPGHHCAADYPSGFCWLNNVQVGIIHAAMTHGLTHAAIIDFDLHHGDGSQSITWDHNRRVSTLPKNAAPYKRTPIGYFSVHDINSYPCEMGDEEKIRSASLCIENAHGQSIWNVHLQPWKNAQEFWRLYETKYMVLIEKARNFLRLHTERLSENPNGLKPKAAIFLSAGFDASEWEGAGMQRHKVNVPTDFYAKFTSEVVKLAEEEGLGVDGRVISVLEGGYSDRALTSGVLSHLCGLASVGSDAYSADDVESSRLASEMRQRLGLAIQNSGPSIKSEVEEEFVSFDTEWWNTVRLEELEVLVNPPPPPLAPKKLKEKILPTYSSPTQASNARRVVSATSRRSISGTPSAESVDMYDATPEPIPDVDWATAAHELSKLLIPSDRQTTSCKHEDLNAEATRVRRERYSTVGVPAAPPPEDGKRMQLRERKAKAPSYVLDEDKPTSRSSRRTTIAAVGELPDPGAVKSTQDGTADFNRSAITHRRRSSAADSISSSVSGMNGVRTSAIGTSTTQRPPSFEVGKIRNGTSTPASSTPGDKPANAPVPKKTRVASGTKPKPTIGRTSPRKAPPVPRVPSTYRDSAATSTTPPSDTNQEVKAELPAQLSTNGDGTGDALDGLASKMKKMTIKLNLPSKEEQAARENAAAEQRKKPVGRPPKKLGAPKATKTASKGPTNIAPKDPAIVSIPPLTQPSHPSVVPDVPPAADIIPEPTPAASTTPAQTLPSPPVSAENAAPHPPHAFVLHKVEPAIDATAPSSIPSTQTPAFQATPQYSPVITAPDPPSGSFDPIAQSPPRHPFTTQTASTYDRPISPPTPRQNLPVFTSTSPICFSGPNPMAKFSNSPPTGYRQPEKSYVPYRPEPTMMGVAGNDLSNEPVGDVSMSMYDVGAVTITGGGQENLGLGLNGTGIGPGGQKMEEDSTIWDVPVTPRQ